MNDKELLSILENKFEGQEPKIYAEYDNKCVFSLKSERGEDVKEYNSQVNYIDRNTGNVHACRFSEIFK